jgi:hypothetical protein
MLRPDTRGKALEMRDSAVDLIPARPTLPKLRDAAAGCRACPLWEHATQTVGRGGSAAFTRSPDWSELAACRPWLEAELAVVRPRVLVCLERRRRRACWAVSSESRNNAASGSNRSSPTM